MSSHSSISSAAASSSDPPADDVWPLAAEAAHEVDRLAGCEAVDRDLCLRLDGAGATREAWIGDEIPAIEPDRTGIGQGEADDLVDERRLACSVVAQQAEDLAGVHVKRDVVVGPHAPAPVRLGEPVDLEPHGLLPGDPAPPSWSAATDTSQYADTTQYVNTIQES